MMISVAMATYNGEKYLKEQLQSIVRQDMKVDEIVVVDDNSSDKTYFILEEFKELFGNEYSIVLQRNEINIGYIANFHKAISLTNGQYIFLCDQDDVWEHDKVAYMITAMEKLHANILCSNFMIIDENGNKTKKKYDIPQYVEKCTAEFSKIPMTTLMMGNVSQGCTYCFTARVRDIYLQIHYDELIHDYQIMLIGAALDGAFFAKKKLIEYRIHSNNSVGFQEKKTLKNIDFIIKHREPRVVTLLKRMKRKTPVKDFYKCILMQYLRIPILGAILQSLLKRDM